MKSMRRRISIAAMLEHIPIAALLPFASPVVGAGVGITTSEAVLAELLSGVEGVGARLAVGPKDVMLGEKLSIVNVLSPPPDGSAIVLRRPGGGGPSVLELVLS